MSSQDNVDHSQMAHPGGSNAKASLVINGNMVVAIVLGIAALIVVATSVGVSFRADERSERAMDYARIMERETRVMEDDLKFIRAFLSARGIDIPANHEQAEEEK